MKRRVAGYILNIFKGRVTSIFYAGTKYFVGQGVRSKIKDSSTRLYIGRVGTIKEILVPYEDGNTDNVLRVHWRGDKKEILARMKCNEVWPSRRSGFRANKKV